MERDRGRAEIMAWLGDCDLKTILSISDLPGTPGVYALYGGTGRAKYVAYVGIAKDLRGRIEQHLIRRDSSIATGTTAACLNPEYVTEVCWWNHKRFRTRAVLEAAELVAYDVLEPVLRSRGGVTKRAKDLYRDDDFFEEMEALFRGEPAGMLVLPSLQHALFRLSELERRVEALERKQARKGR